MQSTQSEYIGLAAAARLLGKIGRGDAAVHPATLTRWIHQGRLRAVRVGSKWATTREWVEEFVAAGTAAVLPAVPTPERSPADRDRAAEAALEKLSTQYGI
jgi:excisionase family DNA binding protein